VQQGSSILTTVFLAIGACFFAPTNGCFGQVVDTNQPNAIIAAATAPKQAFQPNAKRAGLYSAIVPGLGQAYNRQYWKVPIIYAGLSVAGYFFVNNLTNYQNYRKAYVGRINNPYPTDKYVNIYSRDQLLQLQNEYNKFLNLTVLFTSLGYSLQIVEAITGAHLKNFDVSRDISLRLEPVSSSYGPAFGLVMHLK
jgi:hypothetical protein